MKKVSMNYWLDIIAFIEFAFLTTSGILMQYSLPERSGHSMTVWGLSRHQWGDWHYYLALALFTTLALHIVLHWKWIVKLTRGRPSESSGRRLLLGLFGFIVVVLLASAPLLTPVAGEPIERSGHGATIHRN
jgi:hypothetical protein